VVRRLRFGRRNALAVLNTEKPVGEIADDLLEGGDGFEFYAFAALQHGLRDVEHEARCAFPVGIAEEDLVESLFSESVQFGHKGGESDVEVLLRDARLRCLESSAHGMKLQGVGKSRILVQAGAPGVFNAAAKVLDVRCHMLSCPVTGLLFFADGQRQQRKSNRSGHAG
jgi:hypothetical protein